MSDPYSTLVGGTPPQEDDPYSKLAAPQVPAAAPVEDVYSAIQSDTLAPPSDNPTPSIIDHGASFLKGVPMGGKGIVASSMQGLGAMAANPIEMPTERQLRAKQSGDPGQVARAQEVTQAQQREAYPTQDNPLYAGGTALGNWGQDALKPTPGTEFAFDLGSGVGSLAGGVALSLISPTAAGLAFVTAGQGESAERAVKAGATPEQIAKATRFGTVAGATDVVDGLLPILGTPGKLAGFIGKVGAKIIVGAFAEGGQEAVQQLMQNAIAKGIYKPDQDIKEGVAYNALIGAIVGGAAKPLIDRAEAKSVKPATPEATNDAYSALVGTQAPTPAPGDATKLPEAVAPGPPPGGAATQPVVGDVAQTPVAAATVSPIETLLTQPPANDTEAFIRDKAPFSPDASDARAQAAIVAGAVNDQLPLTKKRLELMPEEQMSAEDILASSDIRASISRLPGATIYDQEEQADPKAANDRVGSADTKSYDFALREQLLKDADVRQFPVWKEVARTQGGNLQNGVQNNAFAAARKASLGGKTTAVIDPFSGRAIIFKNGLKVFRDSMKTVPNPRFNVSKLTPEAAQNREHLESNVADLLSELSKIELAREVKGIVRQVAGPVAAFRTATPDKIKFDESPDTIVPGWGQALGSAESQGYYRPAAETRPDVFPLLSVALANGRWRALVTAFHESWHAIEGTLTPQEVQTLIRDTENLRSWVSEMNPADASLYATADKEEIWAEAAAFYSYARRESAAKVYKGPAELVLDKIMKLLERIREVAASFGFLKSSDVFEAFYSGEMASRRDGLPGDMLERWWSAEAGYTKEWQDAAGLSPQLGKSRIEANSSRNVAALSKIDPGITHVPAQIETLSLHKGMRTLFAMTHGTAAIPPPVQQALAHADVMAKRHKWMWGLDRLVDLNPRFNPLLRYAELIREMRTDATKIQDRALSLAKSWRRLGVQMENLGQLLDHIANMRYRTPAEIAAGTVRHPSPQEFQAAVQQFAVSNEALQVFKRQKNFFEVFLSMTTKNAIDEAQRTITNPVELVNKVNAIKAREAELLSKPYFPFLRFGNHYVTIKDAQNNTILFETYERKGLKSAEMVQKAAEKFYQSKLQPGQTISIGVLPETASPFIGLPPELLESIQRDLVAMPNVQGNTPGLTRDQINAIEQLRYAASPAASFAHRFQNKDYVPGYSDDFLRAFSRYSFQGARYYSRVKYGWALRKQIADARNLSKASSDNKIGSIANYMDDHLYNTVLDAKGDFGWLKGGIFLWVFGYSVAGATLNLSQVPMVTYPWLAAKFGGFGVGDGRAMKALARAGTQLENFYKKGSYSNQTAFEMKAIDYGVKTGRISESQASELAGLAQGNTLLGQGNDKFRRGAQFLQEKGTWFFEMAEQYNRRVTFRAALELAKNHPNSKGVQEAMAKYADEYRQLVQSNTFNPSDAQSVVAAIHATEQTQFVYARENRPRFMRGRLAGTILVFKTYLLNVLQLMGANKSSVMPRQLIMLLAMGGIMGLPGAEDLEDVINVIGKWMFGKDFNVNRQLREWLVESVGDKADVVLHGLARRGFGIPALVDILGSAPGRGLGSGHSNNVPFPVLDRSKAVSMGRILPFDLGSLADPLDVDKAIAANTQQASGAVFGVGFNLYRALMDQSTGGGDLKRWERAMPRAVASASRAYRAFSEERSRGKGGPEGAPSIINYDPRDPEQMAEIVALGLGYTPLRQSAKWDLIMAQSEAEKRLQIEQNLVLQNRFEAQSGGRAEEIDRANQAIRDYNEQLPEWARGYKISPDTFFRSMEMRQRQKDAREAGVPMQRRARPVAEYLQGLFPEATVDVRKVR